MNLEAHIFITMAKTCLLSADRISAIYRSFPGRPRPKVTWFHENTVIDDSYEIRSDGLTVNHLTFPNVGRQHLKARLTCQATNNNMVAPATKVVILDINCKYNFITISLILDYVKCISRFSY